MSEMEARRGFTRLGRGCRKGMQIGRCTSLSEIFVAVVIRSIRNVH